MGVKPALSYFKTKRIVGDCAEGNVMKFGRKRKKW
jgi:hypothetical protein